MGLLRDYLARRRSAGSGPAPTDVQVLLTRHKRKQAIFSRIAAESGKISAALILIGHLWLLLLPVEHLGEPTKIDEHALQVGQASTYVGWDSVHAADRYLDGLKDLLARNATNIELSSHLSFQFSQLGLLSSTQTYTTTTSLGTHTGTNVWASLVPPRTGGTEAIVLAASWESLAFEGEQFESELGGLGGERMLNLRGVATLLALAEYLRGTNHYAKTLVFVISDQHLEGMQAFLSAYHGTDQSNLVTEPLTGLQTGVIWTALCIDYPGHSFSHLGLYFEGTNGRLPNQDLLNTVLNVAQHSISVPVRLYSRDASLPSLDHHHNSSATWWSALPLVGWLWRWLAGKQEVRKYVRALGGLKEHWAWAGLGRSSGVHGVFLQYRIDALTLFALPSTGPHGFHSLLRTLELSLRSLNNLLERLHASLFFYLYLRPGWATKVGSYLPAGILIGSGVTIRGLGRWRDARLFGCAKGEERGRSVVQAVGVMVACHAAMGGVYWLGTESGWFKDLVASVDPSSSTSSNPDRATQIFNLLFVLPNLFDFLISFSLLHSVINNLPSNLPLTISALTHFLLGAIIPTLSMLNFPQSILLSTLLLPPLLLVSPPSSSSFPSSSTSLKPLPTQTQTQRTKLLRAFFRQLLLSLVVLYFTPIGIAVLAKRFVGEETVKRVVRSLIEEGELLGNWTWVSVWVVWAGLWLDIRVAGLMG